LNLRYRTIPHFQRTGTAAFGPLIYYGVSSIPWYSVVSNTLRAVEAFRDMGCKVEEVQVPWTEESASAAWTYLLHLFGASC
jgi:Asp-tRNA(Asn)/Glu-tRNA(Gln) amidotransferase A subunit family amidase